MGSSLNEWFRENARRFRNTALELSGGVDWKAGRILNGAKRNFAAEAERRRDAGDRSFLDSPEERLELFVTYMKELTATLNADINFPLFESVLAEHRSKLVNSVRARVRRSEIAEELAQEAQIKLLEYLKERACFGLPQLPELDLTALLYWNANRVTDDYFRSLRPEDELPQTLRDCSADPLGEVLLAEGIKQKASVLEAAINKLARNQAIAFRMRYLEGRSMEQIAEALEGTVKTAYVTLCRARQNMLRATGPPGRVPVGRKPSAQTL